MLSKKIFFGFLLLHFFHPLNAQNLLEDKYESAPLSKIFNNVENYIRGGDFPKNCYKKAPVILNNYQFDEIKLGSNFSTIINILTKENINYIVKRNNKFQSFIIIPNVIIHNIPNSRNLKIRAIFFAFKNNEINRIKVDLLHGINQFYAYFELWGYRQYYHLYTEAGTGCTHYGFFVASSSRIDLEKAQKYPLINEADFFGDYDSCGCNP